MALPSDMPQQPQAAVLQGPGHIALRAALQPRPASHARPVLLRPMRGADLPAVVSIEAGSYGFPWTRGNFIDALAAGYAAEVLVDFVDGVVGYFVAMPGVDELHLLNITVAPGWRGLGHGNRLLDAVHHLAQGQGAQTVWLEVRASNLRAQALYRRRGFALVATRALYYPGPRGTREDAVVMRLPLAPTQPREQPKLQSDALE